MEDQEACQSRRDVYLYTLGFPEPGVGASTDSCLASLRRDLFLQLTRVSLDSIPFAFCLLHILKCRFFLAAFESLEEKVENRTALRTHLPVLLPLAEQLFPSRLVLKSQIPVGRNKENEPSVQPRGREGMNIY